MSRVTPEQQARFEELLDVVPEGDRKLMFGCPSVLVDGRMFFGVHPTGLFARLPADDAEELLADGGTPFTPMPGRTMSGFWTLPDGDVADWVRRAYEHTKAMPPKKQPSTRGTTSTKRMRAPG